MNQHIPLLVNPAEYGTNHQTLLASCRAGNVIGGGDWAGDRIIPDIMRATDAGEPVEIRSPWATRPWQHVLEPLGGYLLVGKKLLEGDAKVACGWNFGPTDEGKISVQQVVEYAKTHWDRIDYRFPETTDGLHEANLLKLDCSKAHSELGWAPVWGSEKTFEKTVSWYREFYESGKILTGSDLSAYTDLFNKRGSTDG